MTPCQRDPEHWNFWNEGESLQSAEVRRDDAAELCFSCPLLLQCHAYVLDCHRAGVAIDGVVAGDVYGSPHRCGVADEDVAGMCPVCGKPLTDEPEVRSAVGQWWSEARRGPLCRCCCSAGLMKEVLW
ncbi:hypothetical protein KRX51_03140 [Corynebacterium sp. TAE3-ERU12]|uniref:hypothetical protein n=1 Tax=Corynebacterium sp. TAE3-ERU12 TaxID=2849491 RepID=UPI001C43E975|nr:hypothetical protein [Corynebacterium sp. TAE3-ERU12]MBV7294913.1 hypothetical protein [Corynebacterium sp. TAE3-ERU12]